jgi:hypothetical protein
MHGGMHHPAFFSLLFFLLHKNGVSFIARWMQPTAGSDPIRSRSPCDCIRTSYAGSGWVYIWNEQVMRLLPAGTTTANKRSGGWGGLGWGGGARARSWQPCNGRTSTILATNQLYVQDCLVNFQDFSTEFFLRCA